MLHLQLLYPQCFCPLLLSDWTKQPDCQTLSEICSKRIDGSPHGCETPVLLPYSSQYTWFDYIPQGDDPGP